MIPLPIAILGEARLVVPCAAFFTNHGFTPARLIGRDAEACRLIEEQLGSPALPFDACNPEALRPFKVMVATDDLAFQRQALQTLVNAGCSRRNLILHGGLYSQDMADLLEAITPDHATGPNAFLHHLLSHYPESGFNPIRVLADLVATTIKRNLVAGQKTLAVYYPDSAYRPNLGSEGMYQKIRDKGYNVIFLFGTKCRDEFESRPGSYYVGQEYRPLGILTYLDFIDVLLVPSSMEGLPERSRVVLSIHDIFDSPVGRDTFSARLASPDGSHQNVPAALPRADTFDYLLVPSTVVMAGQEKCPMVRKNRVAIPSGYMKLDHNIRKLAEWGQAPDSIVFATTVMKNEFAPYVALPDFGEPVVAALLEHFPAFKIIFRPHPHTLPFKCVSDLVERFSGNPRFRFDGDASEYMPSYARSALMVSDMSGTAFTYAFTTLRPVVFFSHNEAGGVEAAFQDVAYFRHRQDIGFVTTCIDDLVAKVRLALEQREAMRTRIQAFRDGMMYNLGHVEDGFVESLDWIMAGEMRPEWTTLPSHHYCGVLEDPSRQERVPQLIELGFEGFNLVEYQSVIYALSQNLGIVHLQELDPKAKQDMMNKGLLVIGSTVEDVKRLLQSKGTVS